MRSVAVLRSSPLKNSDVNTLQDGLDPTRDSVYKKAPEIKWADAQSGTDKNANIKEKVQIKKKDKNTLVSAFYRIHATKTKADAGPAASVANTAG